MANNALKIDCISDTHGLHENISLPGGDLLIHAGDCCSDGQLDDSLEFLDWLKAQNYSHRLLVPGNHDSIFELIPEQMKEECKKRQIILLNDSGCIIEGMKIWGSPVLSLFSETAFHREKGEDIQKHWNLIPKDTEVLITHCPPYGILDVLNDKHFGCEDLYETIQQTRVKLHVFGHIHAASGVLKREGRLYINASAFTRVLKLNQQFQVSPPT